MTAKEEQWHKAMRSELDRNGPRDISATVKAVSSKEQIEASPKDWLNSIGIGDAKKVAALNFFITQREAQAHAAGKREGVEMAAKLIEQRGDRFGKSRIADTFNRYAAEIRKLISEAE